MPMPRRPERRTLGVGGAPRRLATARRTPSCSPEARKQGNRVGATPSKVWPNWKPSRTTPLQQRKNAPKAAELEPSYRLVDMAPAPVAGALEPLVVEDLTANGASTALIDLNNDSLQAVLATKGHARGVSRPDDLSTRPGTSLTSLSFSSRSRRAAGLESNSAWPTARSESRQTAQQQQHGVSFGQKNPPRSHTQGASKPTTADAWNAGSVPWARPSSTPLRRPLAKASNEGSNTMPEARLWQDALTVADAEMEVVESVGQAAVPSEPPKSSSRCSHRGGRGPPARAILPPLHLGDIAGLGVPQTSRTAGPAPESRWGSKGTTIGATKAMNEEQVNASNILSSSRSVDRADAESSIGGFTAEELWHCHRSQAMRPANTMEAVWHLQPEYHECTPQWTFAVK